MPRPPLRPGTTPRRAFLRLAALAPLAAGCATLPAGPAAPPRGRTDAPPAPDLTGDASLEAVRAFPLPAEAEPAAVFRAAPGRGRGG